ncbi:MAG: response regulator [Desulfobacterales bacterium]
MQGESKIDVYIVDDDPSVQGALKRLIRSHGFSARVFSSAGEFLSAGVAPEAAGCLLLDVEMPEMSGMELQAELRRRGMKLAIVFITGHGSIPLSVQAVKDGAVDFMEKPFEPGMLVAAIKNALARSLRLVAQESDHRRARKNFDALTARERDVFSLVARGLLNKQVGFRLGIGEKTVKVHRARVMAKMQAATLADLVRLADKLKLSAAME